MKRLKLLFVVLTVLMSLNAFCEKPTLKFKDHKFRIVQFTDLHWINDAKYRQADDSTYMLMRKVIETEKPDMVVFTGDVVVSSGAAKGWEQLVNLMGELKTPFAVAFGNHDTETDLTKPQILKILEKSSYNLISNADKSIAGVGNCSIPILSENGKKDKWVIYLFDSHAYSQLKKVEGYDWIKHDQIDWYRKESANYTKVNKKPLPSLAFFHIPVPEFATIKGQKGTVGNCVEGVCSPSLNSGLFASFIDMKDVMGVFCGHDHNNDYIGTIDDICLAYGRKTGYPSAYKEVLERGARVIDLYENDSKFDTCIWALSGQSFNYTFERK